VPPTYESSLERAPQTPALIRSMLPKLVLGTGGFLGPTMWPWLRKVLPDMSPTVKLALTLRTLAGLTKMARFPFNLDEHNFLGVERSSAYAAIRKLVKRRMIKVRPLRKGWRMVHVLDAAPPPRCEPAT